MAEKESIDSGRGDSSSVVVPWEKKHHYCTIIVQYKCVTAVLFEAQTPATNKGSTKLSSIYMGRSVFMQI